MVALKILDVKSFMSNLLIQPVFDNFLLSEMEINTFNHFQISGKLNRSWYSSDELEMLEGRTYSKWSEIKPIAFQLIKGNKTPLSFKIVFLLSPENTQKILTKSRIALDMEEVNGLFLNMKFENGVLSLITGVSIRTFTMDKSLDNEWDSNMKTFLKHYEIIFEEL